MEVSRIMCLTVAIILAIAAIGIVTYGQISSLRSDVDELRETRGLGKGSVTSLAIATGAVTTEKLADSAVEGDKIADGAVTSAKILDETITASDIATGEVTSAKILDGTIVTDDIADSAVTSAKIASSAVTEAKIAAGAVTTAKIADNAVDNTKLYENAVLTHHIAAGAVTTAKIATDTIENINIKENAIAYSELRLKIMCGKVVGCDNGDNIAHHLGREPNTVILTIENDILTGENMSTACVAYVNEENIRVYIWKIVGGVPKPWQENIYWIAIDNTKWPV